LPVARLPQISAAELQARLQRAEPITVVDVRSAMEWNAGHIPGAVHLPVADASHGRDHLPGASTLATICEGGTRSMLAASLLARAGLTGVINVVGGMNAYRALTR
jgi:hydroxyacylglutathione hydrolase